MLVSKFGPIQIPIFMQFALKFRVIKTKNLAIKFYLVIDFFDFLKKLNV